MTGFYIVFAACMSINHLYFTIMHTSKSVNDDTIVADADSQAIILHMFRFIASEEPYASVSGLSL